MSIKSTWPKNIALQQYLSKPNSSITFFLSSPFSVLSLYSSHKWPIGLPQLKHLTGIIIGITCMISVFLPLPGHACLALRLRASLHLLQGGSCHILETVLLAFHSLNGQAMIL